MALKAYIKPAEKFKEAFDIDEEYETLEERHKIIQDRVLKFYTEKIGYIYYHVLLLKTVFAAMLINLRKDGMNV